MPWLRIGTVGQFPIGELRIFRLLGRVCGVRREADGSWFALELACRHQGADLAVGSRTGSTVTCPRHGWSYDLADGRCLTAPDRPLRRLGIREEDGAVRLDPTPADPE